MATRIAPTQQLHLFTPAPTSAPRDWTTLPPNPDRAAPVAETTPAPAAATPAIPGLPGFIPPCYWDDLWLYTTPGACRPAIALVGPAGNGKTTTAEAVLAARGYTYLVIDANEYLEPADLVGAMTFDPQVGEVWRDGPVTRAFRAGQAILINEFDALNPRAAMCLQSVMQSGPGRYVTTPGAPDHDRITPTGDCPLILTMNTYGTGATRQYVGRNTLDAASLDRITLITTGYENDAAIIERSGYSRFTAQRLAAWAVPMRDKIDENALRVILSLRTLLRMAQMIDHYGRDMTVAIEKEFLSRLETDVRDLLTGGNES